MKHARFLLKFRPNKSLPCSLEPQYLRDLKLEQPLLSRIFQITKSKGADLEMREAIIPSARTQSCSSYTTPRRD